MKSTFLIYLLCILHYTQYAQETFVYSPVEAQDNIILDAIIENDTVLALQISFDTLK